MSREHTEAIDRECDDAQDTIRELRGANARFLGTCPVAYCVWPLGISSLDCCTMYSPISRALQTFDEDRRHQILEDMLLLSTASINAGIVLRGVEHPERPVPGRFVREN